MKLELKFIFAWYDFWIGLFWDKEKHWLYIFVIPTIGIIIKIKKQSIIDNENPKHPWNWRK